MLLTKGLIRVGIGVPSNAEFELIEVDDPYGYASAIELSLFRRPLPTTNLPFLATVMGVAALPGTCTTCQTRRTSATTRRHSRSTSA
jgi:hypothetical protein